MKAILIPTEGGPVVFDLVKDDDEAGTLTHLQHMVAGHIEALPFPYRDDTTCYIEEEGKFQKSPNPMATAILAPILFPGDGVHGPVVVCGFNAAKGENQDVPDEVIEAVVNAPSAAGGTDGLGASQ